ncbi:hypothetical protein [Costertonia aggregata]|uniref:Uncharacterized protein n=1 Tax=Costertonia aggregata TaxID=343403 RepID=A0A7H9APJ1_9FLAO|nr:hypothetical protein [Costertonia aggregata]QLG45378.1 hypothetical protein HYG79_08465 [Costertonia aggregata]
MSKLNINQEGYETKIIDETNNGYLKIESVEEGCGCYYETTVAAYKQYDGGYTVLKKYCDACGWQKVFSASRNLKNVLPKDFGLADFIPKANTLHLEKQFKTFYLEAEIPKKGTDTKLDLTFIPFGIKIKAYDTSISLEGYDLTNSEGQKYHGDLRYLIYNVTDTKTLNHIISGEIEKINTADQQLIYKVIGEEKAYQSFEILSTIFKQLEQYYNLSKNIEYKSVVLGWNRKTGRFFIKEKIKNQSQHQTLHDFLKAFPFLLAVC